MIANAVDVDDPGIQRLPASALQATTATSATIPVTVDVPAAGASAGARALDAGAACARGAAARAA